jgi:peroxiredoxin
MERKARLGLGAAAVTLALAAVVLMPAAAKPARGDMAPDFTGTALDGRKVSLSDFRGKNPVLLNFYADFCGPCRKEFPHLKALDERLGARGLRIVAVSLDEDRKDAAALPGEVKVKFPVLFDPKQVISEKYEVQTIPHTVVIGKDGRIQQIITGLDLTALDRAAEAALQ